MSKPTKQDKQEFFLFCKNATIAQLEAIVQKEKNRPVYSKIAFKVLFDKLAHPDMPIKNTVHRRYYWQTIPERIG